MVKVQAIEACEATSKLKKEKNKEPAKNKNHKHDPANKHVDYEHFFVYCLIFLSGDKIMKVFARLLDVRPSMEECMRSVCG